MNFSQYNSIIHASTHILRISEFRIHELCVSIKIPELTDKQEVTNGWRTLYIQQIHNFIFSRNIWMMETRRMIGERQEKHTKF